jgi:hypothetical protein
MSTNERIPYETQLRAVGRLLDQRAGAAKEVCVLQAGDGYIVHMLAPTAAVAGPAFAPTTLVIGEPELQAALRDLEAPKSSGWWGRR